MNITTTKTQYNYESKTNRGFHTANGRELIENFQNNYYNN